MRERLPYRRLRARGSRGPSVFSRRHYVLHSYFGRELHGHSGYYKIARAMAEAAQIKPSDTVLDVGAGTGFGAWAFFPLPGTMKPLLTMPKKYVAVEPNKAMASGLAMYLASPEIKISTYKPVGKTPLIKNTEIIIGKAEDLKGLLHNRKVDKVFLSNVLHWTNQLQTLKAVRAVIRENGLFVFDVHNTMYGPLAPSPFGQFFDSHPFVISFKASVARQLRQLGYRDTGTFGKASKPTYSIKQLMADVENSGFEITGQKRLDNPFNAKDLEEWAWAAKMWFDSVPQKGKQLSQRTQNQIIETAIREARPKATSENAISTSIVFVCKPK